MKYIKINPADNVAVALEDLSKGDVVEGVTLSMDIPRGHKIVLSALKAGDNVIKYGYPIGHVTRDAAPGTMVDHSCIKTNLEGLLEYKYQPSFTEEDVPSRTKTFSPKNVEKVLSEAGSGKICFRGFRRSDGQVGVRNQIWVIPTVGCVNGICQQIVESFRREIEGKEGSVDAVVAFPHNYGCSQLGSDHENTRTILADMAVGERDGAPPIKF